MAARGVAGIQLRESRGPFRCDAGASVPQQQLLLTDLAMRRLKDGADIRTVQELLGNSSVGTTMIYTHVLNRGGRGVTSPLDTMETSEKA